MAIPMTNPRYFPPGGGQSMRGGLERWVPNGVYSLTKPRPVPPSDAELRKEYPGLQWVEVRNRSDDYCSIGECVVFDKPVLDVDYKVDSFLRGRDDVWLDGYPGQLAGSEADPYIAEDNVLDASYQPIASQPFGRSTAQNRFSNWGISIDPIPAGGSGRVAVGGVLLVPIVVRHPAMRYIEPRQDTELYRYPQTTVVGNGEILWLSEHPATHPYALSTDGTEHRYALVRLGNTPQVSFIAYLESSIPALDVTDATNPTISSGDVTPMRKGYDLDNPFEVLDNKLRTYATDWNDDAGDNLNIRAFNYSEVDIPAGVYVTVYWDANSRCFVATPPALDWEAYLTSDGTGTYTNWSVVTTEDNLGLAYSAANEDFTALSAMRLSVTSTSHFFYSLGTTPFELHYFMERDTGGGFSFYRGGYTAIRSASIRECATINTQIDLAAGDKIRFDWTPRTGMTTALQSYADLKLHRVINA